ncbi:hypothetical protein [Antarcticirhabdus aurantiaca]|uniref:Uncharacterized protein n=1 Tax=Antarcticirhabdus aurantiaca TaxID=2606717 RepID=A0ACD4NKY9_9HYPH|nr:hypothetical protein [Antarcticirhabdus aurantiaca]WAJ27394.1 hypothetical protein OXU80_21490 [Jeongeuplla avenae]
MPDSLRRNVLGLIRHGEKQHTEISLYSYSQATQIVKQPIEKR